MPPPSHLRVKIPRWFLPYLKPLRYKGLKGGRASGKSHAFAQHCVMRLIDNPNTSIVCIREVQKSLKFSAKRLIESKIQSLGVGPMFDVLESEIRSKLGGGIIIFQGMQDHTAESIKSLEGFNVAWIEEAQSLSMRSLNMLDPTIRDNGSELWASWNPDQPDNPIETFFGSMAHGDALLTHVNYTDNPFCPDEAIKMAEKWKLRDPDSFGHVWLGEFASRTEAQVLNGKCTVEEFDPAAGWNGPYFGADWGFSQDPTTLIKCWVHNEKLYVERELYRVGLEISDTPAYFRTMPGADKHTIRADSARPETISHVKRAGLNVVACEKWKGSVEDGIAFLRSFEKIIIHPRCENTAIEARLYSYKTDRLTGDVLTDIIDANNHAIDAIRYALAPLIKPKPQAQVW